jgi:hypothetical protein
MQSLQQYMVARLPAHAAAAVHLDDVDEYEDRSHMLPSNPQQREGLRAGRLARPHMWGTRKARARLRLRQQQLQLQQQQEGAMARC